MRFLCLSRDIEEGGYFRVDGFGKSLIVTRIDGRIFVDENACRHRGFPVAEKPCGKLPLRCPYHDLVFANVGALRATEFEGFVFLGDARGFSSLDRSVFDSLGEEFGSHSQQVEAPFSLWMQNTMDPAHLRTVHGEGFASFFEPNMNPFDVSHRHDPCSSYRMMVKLDVVQSYAKYSSGWNQSFIHLSVFPHLSVTNFLGVFASVEEAIPTGPKRCQVTTRFFTDRSACVPSSLLPFALKANQKTLQEDKNICERWAKGKFKRTPKNWLPGEDRIQAYLNRLQNEALHV